MRALQALTEMLTHHAINLRERETDIKRKALHRVNIVNYIDQFIIVW